MNYAALKPTDVANGPGVRVAVFVSGCTHYCEDCFNSEAWDFGFGTPFSDDTMKELIKAMDHSYISGLSLLGGEPLHPVNREGVLEIISTVRRHFPEKTIWCYTGYELDRELLPEAEADGVLWQILGQLDVLVDGRFVPEKKDLMLVFKGSSNQRILDMKQTLESGKLVFWEEVKN